MLSAGTLLQNGKYLINGVLSHNSHSTLYLATCIPQSQQTVLKTICPPSSSADQETDAQRARYWAESRRLTEIRHPHLVGVMDCFVEADHTFMAMEFIQGQNLAQKMAEGPLPESEALHYIRQIGSGLTFLHFQGLLHRDVKPANIIVSDESSSAESSSPEFSKAILVNCGSMGQFLLDPALVDGENGKGFAPPEQYTEAHSKTAATDVYGLAATLYALTTGQVPTVAILRDRIPLPPPHELNPDLSPQTGQAILFGMALRPQDRPPAIDAWLALLPNLELSADALGHSKQEPTDLDVSQPSPPVSASASSQSSSQPSEAVSMPTPKNPVVQSRPSTKRIVVPRPRSSALPKRALLMSAAIAALGGAGFGFYLRTKLFAPLLSPNQSPLSAPTEKIEESFPPKERPKLYDSPTRETDPIPNTPSPTDTFDLPEIRQTPSTDETIPSNSPEPLNPIPSQPQTERSAPPNSANSSQGRTNPKQKSQNSSPEDDLSPNPISPQPINPTEENLPSLNPDFSDETPRNSSSEDPPPSP